ncbi:MAG: hypothetical protein BAJATHORv1_70072 [Candidatus Thorarchaeota archaeon]|nr:MAG: hypothetical protein BAJATHORv1_70072 [Candidatus Thorarchaeota archaeon]
MLDLVFDKIEEFIFAPFNTFIYLDTDEILFRGLRKEQWKLVEELNKEHILADIPEFSIEWTLEDSSEFKLSKGVFTPPGTDNSFVVAKLIHNDSNSCCHPICDEVSEKFPIDTLIFKDVRFYFSDVGVATCSVRVEMDDEDGITILELEETSERLNVLFKKYFEDISFRLAEKYIELVNKLEIPYHRFSFLPDIREVDKSTHFIPWTHRIYHIPADRMFDMDNPGEHFRTLLTPSSKMDIEDLSIYENRYVYFGWGHSIIFTSSQEDGYSQTSRPVYDYVRLVEIAQAKWQFLDVLKDVIKYALSSFNRHFEHMELSDLQDSIIEVRSFTNGINRILADYRGIKITFDTEKRILLRELHDRWLTDNLLEALTEDLESIEELLDQLYQRQKEQREESLNTIALLFTIVGIIEIIALVIEILYPVFEINPFVELGLIALGTISMAIIISLYLRYSSRG